MRWSAKTGERVFLWPLMALLAPVWVPMVAFIFVCVKLEEFAKRIERRFAHPKAPHQWFAWRPVQASCWSDHNGEWFWLETIWRGRDRWGNTAYAPTPESLESAL